MKLPETPQFGVVVVTAISMRSQFALLLKIIIIKQNAYPQF